MTILTGLHFNSWLSYFFAVPEVEQQAYPKGPTLLQEVGVLLTHKAVYAEEEVKAWMRTNFLTGEQLNKSFYKSWNSLKEKSDIELLRDKVLHYFSTYGMQELGLYTQDMIYIPEHVLNMPEKVGFKVLSTLSFEEATRKCLDTLQQGIALKQETIVDILNILEDCQYTFLPEDIQSISNREALVFIADKTGILPNKGDDLFRYIFYKATGGSTLVINDKASKLAIANTQYALPPLSTRQCQELAKSYQRRKSLWLSIKTANREANASLVNQLNKLSKVFHEPMKPDVIGSLTSEVYSQQIVSQLLRAEAAQLGGPNL